MPQTKAKLARDDTGSVSETPKPDSDDLPMVRFRRCDLPCVDLCRILSMEDEMTFSLKWWHEKQHGPHGYKLLLKAHAKFNLNPSTNGLQGFWSVHVTIAHWLHFYFTSSQKPVIQIPKKTSHTLMIGVWQKVYYGYAGLKKKIKWIWFDLWSH